MKIFLVVASLVVLARAEPPTSYSHSSLGSSGGSSRFQSFQPVPSVSAFSIPGGASQNSISNGYSSSPQQSYGSPAQAPQQPSSSYGSPQQPSSSYGSPQQQQQLSYGAPAQSQQPQQGYSAQPSYQQPQYHSNSQAANVQVSYGSPPALPPGHSYGPPPVVTGATDGHDIEYRVVYKPVKAPKPDLVLPPPPPKTKTIVYILVPRIEPPEPIIVPTHAPTPPSKPEVYFIRYKAPKKPKAPSGGYGVPSNQYGSPSAPKPVVVEAPQQKKREVEKTVSVTSSISSSSAEEVSNAGRTAFGQKVGARRSTQSQEETQE